MSAEAATLPTEQAGEAHAAVFRIAFAAAVGLTLGEVLRWAFPFLPAMLAVHLLSARGPLSVKQGLAFVAVMAAACVSAVLISQIFDRSPLVLLLVVSLLVFLEFLLLARGRAVGVAATFLITTAVVPLLAIGIRVRGSRFHLFADCRKRAGGPVDLRRTRALPHASTGRAGFRPPALRSEPPP